MCICIYDLETISQCWRYAKDFFSRNIWKYNANPIIQRTSWYRWHQTIWMCRNQWRSQLCNVSLLRANQKSFTDSSDYGTLQKWDITYIISRQTSYARKKTFHHIYQRNTYTTNISIAPAHIKILLNLIYKYCQPNIWIKTVFFWLFTYRDYTSTMYFPLLFEPY